MTYDIRHVVVIESTMYRKDIKVYIKQETVYDIWKHGAQRGAVAHSKVEEKPAVNEPRI